MIEFLSIFFSRVSNFHYRAHRCVLKKLLWIGMDVNFCLPTYLLTIITEKLGKWKLSPTYLLHPTYLVVGTHTKKLADIYLSQVWVLKSLSRARNYFGGLHKLRSQDFAHYWPPTHPLLTFVKEFIYWNKGTSSYRWHFQYHLTTYLVLST